MRTLSEVLEALGQRWDAPLKEIDGFSYVPWEETAYHLDEVFGPLGWSDHTTEPRFDVLKEFEVWEPVTDAEGKPIYENNKPKKNRVIRDFYAYICTVDITVQVYDEEHDRIITATKSGVGSGPVNAQGAKNPLDTAVKACGSDALSKAAKKLGDAFALFLYREKKRNNGSGASSSSGSRSNGFPVSAGRVPHLTKLGYTSEQVDAMSNAQASKFFDTLWTEKKPLEEAVKIAGIPLPANPPTEKPKQQRQAMPA